MKIHFFSPVPPTPSSIAGDLPVILPALARHAVITLWVHEKNWDRALEAHARIRHYDCRRMPWEELNAADVTIYHLGNEAANHGPIWQISRRHPGLVVLHDLKLQHLFAGMVAADGLLRRREYLRLMDHYHPNDGRELGAALLAGARAIAEVNERCPLTPAALENALAVAVHTQLAVEELAAATDIPVEYLPLCAHPLAAASPPRPKIPGARVRLAIFGYLGANRRLSACVEALHGLPEKARFQLDIYGRVADEVALRAQVEKLELQQLVKIHGYVSEAELDAALASADLAINLRDPTMGEASASQLRIWQHGLPSLVTDIGWYATLPSDTVARVRRTHERADIQQHLLEFLRTPERYREIGQNGRRYVREHHTVEAYVTSLLGLIESVCATPGRAAARWMAGRAGNVMGLWFHEDATEVLLPRPAAAIDHLFCERASDR